MFIMMIRILFMNHAVLSPQLHIFWSEDGPLQWPKHVVSLNKDKQHNIVVFLLKNYPYLTVKKKHNIDDSPKVWDV